MSEPATLPIEIAIAALKAELVRVRGKLDGAVKRLTFALSQVQSETGLRDGYLLDILDLENAIVILGGQPDPVEPIQPDVPPDPPIPNPDAPEPVINATLGEEIGVTDNLGTGAGTLTEDIPPDAPPPVTEPDLEPPAQTLSLNVDDSVDTGDAMG